MSEVLTDIYFLFERFLVEAEYNAHFAAYETLLRESDVIVICVPLNANTRHMINATQLNKMKKGVVLINIARGPVVDEAALIEALESGRVSRSYSRQYVMISTREETKLLSKVAAELIKNVSAFKVGSAGLDVFEFEPKVPEALLKHPRCTLLPHMGTSTEESLRSMEVRFSQRVVVF